MISRATTVFLFLLSTFVIVLALEVANADDGVQTKTPVLNDNVSAPFMGVYRWGQGGCVNGNYEAFAKWVNHKVIWAEDFMPTEGWNKIEGEDWQLGTWEYWVKQQPGRRLILSVPVLVGSWDKKGPSSGPDAGVPVSLQDGAAGKYNEHFRLLAEHLVAHNLGDTILRIGWEFNGGWYIWRAQSEDDGVAFGQYFKQIVTTMRAVPGAQNLKFVWNPTLVWSNYSLEKAWPGDEYVDYIGVDVYDDSWGQQTYPIPANASPAEIEDLHEKVWDQIIVHDNNHGLALFRDMAQQHHKPLVFPEWGVDIRGDDHGGRDDPYFVEQMHNFIYDPANNVYFHCYFDVTAGDGDHQISPGLTGKDVTKFPLSAAKFKELFALPEAGTSTAASK